MEGSLWALICPIILCCFPFDILLRTQSLCCHAMLFPRSLWHHKEQLQRRLPFGGHLIGHLWHDTEVVCYSQKFSEKSWRLESKWNTIFWGCRVKCHTCTCTSPPPKPRGRGGEGPHGLWGEDVWHFKLCGSLPWKISRSNGTSEKLLLFFRTESS